MRSNEIPVQISKSLAKQTEQTQFLSPAGEAIRIKFPKEKDNALHLGQAPFAQAGFELAPLCQARPRQGVIEHTLNQCVCLRTRPAMSLIP
jgi:hypothetical protein